MARETVMDVIRQYVYHKRLMTQAIVEDFHQRGRTLEATRRMAHLWKVQEVEGNVSLKVYLLAAGLCLTPQQCMQLGARCNYRSRVMGSAIGKMQQRRGRTAKLSAGHCRHGWHLVSTFPPDAIAIELKTLGFAHQQPSPAKLLAAMKQMLPLGHKLNPAAPAVALYA
jgi:hypothetical protein